MIPEVVLDDPIMNETYQKKNYVNWADLVFSNALQHKHDLSVRGGSEKSNILQVSDISIRMASLVNQVIKEDLSD